tara:strand:+ start:38 stop:307 length:270 start_codon:yes stop_codon:yes gene_type:complete
MRRSIIAVAISILIAMVSLAIMIVEGNITPEAWGLLLLMPIPVALAIARRRDLAHEESDSMEDWVEDSEEQPEGNVGDPADAGFDIPVL